MSAENDARRDLLMMAAAIASELCRDHDMRDPAMRTHVALQAIQLALEIERLTPR